MSSAQQKPPCRWHELGRASMGGVGDERAVRDVESDSAHVLLKKRSLLRRPLESAVHEVALRALLTEEAT